MGGFKKCITLVTYFYLLNGDPKGYIKHSWGLRQGDHNSLYSFPICVEGLTAFANLIHDV